MRQVSGALLLEPGEIELLGQAAAAVAELAGRFGGRELPAALVLAEVGRAVQALAAVENPPLYAMLAPATTAEARRLARALGRRD